MNNLEGNKIFAAILLAGIVASGSGILAKHIVHPVEVKAHGSEEVAEGAAAAPQKPEPILGLIAGADVARGQMVAKACAACHTFDAAGKDGVGPHLWNVMSRGQAAASGFAYSEAMAGHKGKQWTYADLNHFLWKPKSYVPGTKMAFMGVKKPEDRAALIAYLRTVGNAPKGLPSSGEIAAEAAELAPAAPAEAAAKTQAH